MNQLATFNPLNKELFSSICSPVVPERQIFDAGFVKYLRVTAIPWSLFGQFGHALFDFVTSLGNDDDDYHPDLLSYGGGFLQNDSAFATEFKDLISIIKYCQDHEICEGVQNKVRKLVSTLPEFTKIKTLLTKNSIPVRFLPSDIISHMRLQESIDTNLMKVLKEKGESYWQQHPGDFGSYHKSDRRFQKEIEEGQKRYQHFKSHNLVCMAQEILKGLDELAAKANSSNYYGFNRISITTACAILSKVHGLTYADTMKSVFRIDNIYSIKYTQPEQYEGACVDDCICYLDNFPALNYLPLFDNYFVLRHKDAGILLGRRDGEFYFICYFAPYE